MPKMLPCPRECRGAKNCDVCLGDGEISEMHAALLEHFAAYAPFSAPPEVPTERVLDPVPDSERPTRPRLPSVVDIDIDDEPTCPGTPDAKRRATPLPK